LFRPSPEAQEKGRWGNATTPVILCGPYGTALLPALSTEWTNILAIAGGTGVSLTIPIVLVVTSSLAFIGAAIDFVWIIRRQSNTSWITSDLEELKQRAASRKYDLHTHIFVT
jgi:ferric-chelate reductase